jgi:hypothetical protein
MLPCSHQHSAGCRIRRAAWPPRETRAWLCRPAGGSQFAGDVARGPAQRVLVGLADLPIGCWQNEAHGADRRSVGVEDRGGEAGLSEHCLVDLLGERGARHISELRAQRDWSVIVSPVMLRCAVASTRSASSGRKAELRLAQRAGVCGDQDAGLGHLPGAVQARLVVDDHHVAPGQDAVRTAMPVRRASSSDHRIVRWITPSPPSDLG